MAPAAAYGCCRRTARAQEGCWRTGRTGDGPARAEARMPAVGGCMGSEHGRRAPRSRHSARFESRAGRPSRHAASPPAATAGRPASRRPHTGRPQFEPAPPARRDAPRRTPRFARRQIVLRGEKCLEVKTPVPSPSSETRQADNPRFTGKRKPRFARQAIFSVSCGARCAEVQTPVRPAANGFTVLRGEKCLEVKTGSPGRGNPGI